MSIDRASTATQTGAESRFLAPIAAAVLGAALLYLTAFAHVDAIHDGAHDARHSAAVPCH